MVLFYRFRFPEPWRSNIIITFFAPFGEFISENPGVCLKDQQIFIGFEGRIEFLVTQQTIVSLDTAKMASGHPDDVVIADSGSDVSAIVHIVRTDQPEGMMAEYMQSPLQCPDFFRIGNGFIYRYDDYDLLIVWHVANVKIWKKYWIGK